MWPLSGAASVINETSTTSASIDGTVNARGSVEVAADRNTTKLKPLDGNGAVGLGTAGVGLSLSTITTNDTVAAWIGSNGNVTALGQGAAINAPTGDI